MDRSKYIEECLAQFETSNFQKLDMDPTQKFEKKVPTSLQNIKKAIGEEEYKKIYPSGSNPGKFTEQQKYTNSPTKIQKILQTSTSFRYDQ